MEGKAWGKFNHARTLKLISPPYRASTSGQGDGASNKDTMRLRKKVPL